MHHSNVIRAVLALASVTYFGASASAQTSWCDRFEDGSIDPSRWEWGCLKRGYNGPGQGDWQCSVEEIVEPEDGYLSMDVWGPTSGATYGAEAWIRTTYDCNDDSYHLINFTWEVDALDDHVNYCFIQVTDGYISPDGIWTWPMDEAPIPGTTDLLWHGGEQEAPGGSYPSGLPKSDWSMAIDPAGVVRLYDGPCASGSLLREETLDPAYPWYVRFMVIDATSAGFPAGDCRLNLYSFCTTWNSNGVPGQYEWHAYGDHLYTLTKSYCIWVDAEAEAVAVGGHLVTVNDLLYENAWLSTTFAGYYAQGYPEGHPDRPWKSLVWIGLERIEDEWRWVSGEPLTFDPPWWYPGPHPDGDHAYLHTDTHPYPGTWWNSPVADVDPDEFPRGIIEVPDCNANSIPDQCDLDCGVTCGPCDVPGCGLSADCNANGVPDECDIADCDGGLWCGDCNSNGVLDGCEPDFDGDELIDDCDDDIDDDGVPNEEDVCDYTPPGAVIVTDPGNPLYGTLPYGDLDDDCDCDLADYALMQEVFTGPNGR